LNNYSSEHQQAKFYLELMESSIGDNRHCNPAPNNAANIRHEITHRRKVR
jgi:hypothetical protein